MRVRNRRIDPFFAAHCRDQPGIFRRRAIRVVVFIFLFLSVRAPARKIQIGGTRTQTALGAIRFRFLCAGALRARPSPRHPAGGWDGWKLCAASTELVPYPGQNQFAELLKHSQLNFLDNEII